MPAFIIFGASATLPMNPADNIFKARAETPILEQAISDFQEICLTFMLHESEVSKSEDVKHFTAMNAERGYMPVENTRHPMIILPWSFETDAPWTGQNS